MPSTLPPRSTYLVHLWFSLRPPYPSILALKLSAVFLLSERFFALKTMSKLQVQSGRDFWNYYKASIFSHYVLQPCGAHVNYWCEQIYYLVWEELGAELLQSAYTAGGCKAPRARILGGIGINPLSAIPHDPALWVPNAGLCIYK